MDAILFYIEAVYFLTTVVLGVIGLMQGTQLDDSNPQVLDFRKSNLLRLSMGMMSLMFLASIWLFASNASRPADREIIWWLLAPMCVGVAYLLAYLVGPQDVRIDLSTRICYETKGWFFHPCKQTYRLTAASSLCAFCGGQACYAMLRVGDSTNRRFLLAMCNSKAEAYSFAQKIAARLDLPAKETTLAEMAR